MPTHEEFLALSVENYVWEAAIYTALAVGCVAATVATLVLAPLSAVWLALWIVEGALSAGAWWLAISAWRDAARRRHYPR